MQLLKQIFSWIQHGSNNGQINHTVEEIIGGPLNRQTLTNFREQFELEEQRVYIYGSHAHFDHTEGFDQAAVCFDPRNNIHILADHHYLKALDQNLGIFSHHMDMDIKGIQTPLNYELMPAKFHSTEIRDLKIAPPTDDPVVHNFHDINEPIKIGNTTI